MEDLLTLIAELSVGIAGFTAVFSVLDRDATRNAAEVALQTFRVKQMLLGGVVTALGCVVALGLLVSPVARPTVWRVAAGSVCVVLLLLVFFLLGEAKRKRLDEAPGYSHAHAVLVYALAGIGIGLLCFTFAVAGQPIAPSLYVGAMIAMFTLSAIQFVRAAIKQFGASR